MSELLSRVMMMFGRGVLRGTKDDGPRQQVQVELLKGEVAQNRLKFLFPFFGYVQIAVPDVFPEGLVDPQYCMVNFPVMKFDQ